MIWLQLLPGTLLGARVTGNPEVTGPEVGFWEAAWFGIVDTQAGGNWSVRVYQVPNPTLSARQVQTAIVVATAHDNARLVNFKKHLGRLVAKTSREKL